MQTGRAETMIRLGVRLDHLTAEFLCTLCALMLASGSRAEAQSPDNPSPCAHPPVSHSRTSVERLLNGRPLPTSFEEVSTILEPGYEVVVVDESGKKMFGRVSALSDDTVVLCRQRPRLAALFRGAIEERSFNAETVSRIDIVDSTWNGMVIGAALAPAIVYGIHKWEEAAVPDNNDLKGLLTIVLGGIGATAAIGIAYAIDRAVNQSIYERRLGAHAVTLIPWVESNRASILVQVRF